MNIGIVGLGYVGIVTAVTFAYKGHRVYCYDIDTKKTDAIKNAKAPIYEKGLQELIEKTVSLGKLYAIEDIENLVQESEILFISVGTPSKDNGAIDLTYVINVAESIGNILRDTKNGRKIIVTKSTVVPGSGTNHIIPTIEKTSGSKEGDKWAYVANPEFLREGSALYDSFNPDRIVIGTRSSWAKIKMKELYKNFNCQKIFVDITTAEMVKYVSNAFLATKISFANEMARLCHILEIDIYKVMDIVSMDKRINREFLDAGMGFGGSCFPKDLKALKHKYMEEGIVPDILSATLTVNDTQPHWAVEIIKAEFSGNLKDKQVAIIGLAFKPDTDDVRESRAYPIVRALLDEGAKVVCYDPISIENFKKGLSPEEESKIRFESNIYRAVNGCHCAVIQCAWREIKEIDLIKLKRSMKYPFILDGRRAISRKKAHDAGIKYIGLGW